GEIRDLVERTGNEVGELHFCYRPHAHQGGADRGSHDSGLRNRRVDHAPLAESFEHSCGDFEGAAINADVLAKDEHTFILFHFFPDTLTNGFDVCSQAHLLMAASFLEAAHCRACAPARACIRSGHLLMAARYRACIRSAHLLMAARYRACIRSAHSEYTSF